MYKAEMIQRIFLFLGCMLFFTGCAVYERQDLDEEKQSVEESTVYEAESDSELPENMFVPEADKAEFPELTHFEKSYIRELKEYESAYLEKRNIPGDLILSCEDREIAISYFIRVIEDEDNYQPFRGVAYKQADNNLYIADIYSSKEEDDQVIGKCMIAYSTDEVILSVGYYDNVSEQERVLESGVYYYHESLDLYVQKFKENLGKEMILTDYSEYSGVWYPVSPIDVKVRGGDWEKYTNMGLEITSDGTVSGYISQYEWYPEYSFAEIHGKIEGNECTLKYENDGYGHDGIIKIRFFENGLEVYVNEGGKPNKHGFPTGYSYYLKPTAQSSIQDNRNTNNTDPLEKEIEDLKDTETTVPPRKNIAVESASFIVTDNRGDTKLLGYNDCKTFLMDFGFDDTEPFYQYFDEENGALQLTLYYDEETGMGGGVCYDADNEQPGQTGSASEGFVFNSAGKFQYSDAFPVSLQEKGDKGGNIDCYDIYTKGFQSPDYFLYIDHNSDCLCVDLLSRHDVVADAQGKQYGVVGPSLSPNKFTEAVLTKADCEEELLVTHTYAADYDGDGKEEAFVIAGEWDRRWSPLERIYGELWFVDSSLNALRLLPATAFDSWKQYIKQDGKIYLLVNFEETFSSWGALLFSVQENLPILFNIGREAETINETQILTPAYAAKTINDEGQIIVTSDDYDWTYTDLGEGKHMWTGHTWKSYTFEFDHEQWIETPAREVTREEVNAIAILPASFDETDYDNVQYILRENGELNINTAKTNPDYPSSIDFNYMTFRLSATQEWIADDSVDGNGTYAIQLSGEKHWDYKDKLLGYE